MWIFVADDFEMYNEFFKVDYLEIQTDLQMHNDFVKLDHLEMIGNFRCW